MHHSSFAPRLLAMSLLAASALSVSAFAAPVSSSTVYPPRSTIAAT